MLEEMLAVLILSDRLLHREAVVGKSKGPPEFDPRGIADEDFQPDPWDVLPHIFQQPGHRRSPDSAPPSFWLDEELPQVQPIWFPLKKCVPGDSLLVFEEYRLIFAFEPRLHPVFKLRDRHRIAVPFITNQSVIHLSDQMSVRGASGSISHV
jgi:hypothetical protein